MKHRTSLHILCIFLINLLLSGNLQAQVGSKQTVSTGIKPMGIPIFLSGNFGEPRANHFHSGIDIKTGGVPGVPVRSVAPGYVSRIKVEPGGYGQALYLNHPNGYTSVYAHLQSFNKNITEFVKHEQYRRESFSVDLFPESSRFPVEAGQVIASSGNSGSSQGPHLHFEIRDTHSENPINPLIQALRVLDHTAPVMERIVIYSLGRHKEWIKPLDLNLTKGSSGVYTTRNSQPLPLDHRSGIGIQLYELIDGSANRCGVYQLQGYLDDELFFESLMDEFSFAETRYMNSYMDYRIYQIEGRYVLKLFVEPNNRSSIYHFTKNNGILVVRDSSVHELKIVALDVAGNQSVARCQVRLNPSDFKKDPDYLPTYNAFFSFAESNHFSADGLEIDLPRGALYDDLYFKYLIEPTPDGCYSPLHRVHKNTTPLHQFFTLRIRPEKIPEPLKSKAQIVELDSDGRFSAVGGRWEGEMLTVRVRSFGDYTVMLDTIPPLIRAANFSLEEDLQNLETIRFIISDDLSGIHRYRGELDGKWILMEYDQKNRLLKYTWDATRVDPRKTHRLTIQVDDQAGNSLSTSYQFYR